MAARPCDTVVSALSQFDARRKELTEALQFPLNHGKPIPAIGLGAYCLTLLHHGAWSDSVTAYRHLAV